MKLFLLVISMVFIIEGLPYLIFPEKMINFLKILSNSEPGKLRNYGLLMCLIGVVLLYLVK